jgi:hypothetical protein
MEFEYRSTHGEPYAPKRPRASTGINGFWARIFSSWTAQVLPSGSAKPKKVLPSWSPNETGSLA